MRAIDADAFKEYITSACEEMKHLFNDGGAVAKLITESFCKDIDEQPTIQPEPHWIPVTERLPENEVNVLITVEHRPIGRKSYRRVVRAFHEDGTWNDIRSAYSWDDDSWDDYVDEDGNFLIPEGWFEAIDYHGEFCAVDDFVIAWMPLPEPYKGVTT